eukprot:7376358-Prymnesium_polylepis.1
MRMRVRLAVSSCRSPALVRRAVACACVGFRCVPGSSGNCTSTEPWCGTVQSFPSGSTVCGASSSVVEVGCFAESILCVDPAVVDALVAASSRQSLIPPGVATASLSTRCRRCELHFLSENSNATNLRVTEFLLQTSSAPPLGDSMSRAQTLALARAALCASALCSHALCPAAGEYGPNELTSGA